MRFETKQREYAAIAVLELARAYRVKRPLSAQKIAAKYGFSPIFLTQVFQTLKKANLVVAERGPLGGFRLVPDPEELTVGYVVGLFGDSESKGRKSESKTLQTEAEATKARLEDVWRKADAKRQEYLNSVLYSDLITSPDEQEPLNFSI
ncbi:MAG: Rrf2 family transcriptional regulator [Thermoguttaceae bacterium]|nr:Rrf2 family transcriptional regulator [Thermoguttaceae bacterium]